jgi:hypothetical protein
VRLYTNCSTVQGQTITGNCCTHEHDDDWHIFDVETDFARKFDLQSFCQWRKDWSIKKDM